MNDQERLEFELFVANDAVGDLNLTNDKIDCQECKNRGYVAFIDNGYITYQECQCMHKRRNWQLIKQSGLEDVIKRYTFENYVAKEQWQKYVLDVAQAFTKDFERHWFYIGGQVGSGKTMICTSIVGYLLSKNIPVRFIVWRDELRKLKSMFGTDEYSTTINNIQKARVLYIDDFFKGEKTPSCYDTDIAFELLNYRYNNKLTTIISSEYLLDTIMKEYEAIGSRIYELTTEKYLVNLQKDENKNKRMNERYAYNK